MKKINIFLIITTLFILFSLFQPYLEVYFDFSGDKHLVSDDLKFEYLNEDNIVYAGIVSVCTSQCSYYGQKTCSGTSGYKTCGNHDSDSCLEWSSTTSCGYGKTCQGGQCKTTAPSCTSQCSYYGQKTCSGTTGYKTCGNHDSDSCLEWSSTTSCGYGKTCQGGQCITPVPSCTSQCSYYGQKTCSGSNNYKTCGNYDSDSCLEWSTSSCGSGQTCQNGQCITPVPSCTSECSYYGQKTCSGSNNYKTCGNYDSDSCLEWSSAQSCNGSTSCGYGKCNNDQRPSWHCSGGLCDYGCNYDSNCGGYIDDYEQCYNNDVYWYNSNHQRQSKSEDCGNDYCGSWGSNYCSGGDVYENRTCYDKGCSGSSCYSHSDVEKRLVDRCDNDETCENGRCVEDEEECTSGPCCDGQNFKSLTTVCKSETQAQYGCPWGTSCGADSGTRTRIKFRYCSGDSASCDGEWGSWKSWTSWTVNDYCSNTETCSPGNSTCNYTSACTYTPVYNIKQCYDNDVHWFSPAGVRLSKYMECEDDNTCTIDRCETDRCYNDLKCDGSTCDKDSSDYCESCEHCGDGVSNCEETFCSCPIDVNLPGAYGLAVSTLVKKTGFDESWKKSAPIAPNDQLSFLIVVASSDDKTIDEVRLENFLPENIIYQGNLEVDDNPFIGNILTGLALGSIHSGESRVITFDAKATGPENFDMGSTYLNSMSTVYYGDETITDGVGIEIFKGSQGVAAAGTIFGQMVGVIGTLAFWLVILFLLILAVILSMTSYYFVRKKRVEEFAKL